MDFFPALKSDVLRPLVVNLVPGGVALTPYALLFGHRYNGVEELATSYPLAAGVLALFAAMAVGLILENLALLIEAHAWDRIVETDTGCQGKDWEAYLAATTEFAPAGQKYLSVLVTRLKFEGAFGLALVVMWFGVLWLNLHVDVIRSEASVLLASAVALGLASYLIWESGVTARRLADLRHILLEGHSCERPTSDELRADLLDRTLIGMTLLIPLGMAVNWYLLNYHVERGGWHGLSAGTAAVLFGAAVGWIRFFEDKKGRRRTMAFRLGTACLLLAVIFVLRMGQRSDFHLIGLISTALALGLAAWCYFVSYRLAASSEPYATMPAKEGLQL
jgi:hypothetical protein